MNSADETGGVPCVQGRIMECTRVNERSYRSGTLQTTIATTVNAGIGTGVGAKVAVLTTLEKKVRLMSNLFPLTYPDSACGPVTRDLNDSLNECHVEQDIENMGRTWNVTAVYDAASHLQR